MGKVLRASRTQTDVPLSVLVTRDGGIPGLTVALKIFNGNNLSQFLDFNDGVFKDAGHVTPTLAAPLIQATEAPGVYAIDGGFDLSAITVPAAAASLLVRYTITAGGETGDDVDTIQFDDTADAILADTAAMQPTVTANLDVAVSSRGTTNPGDAMGLVTDAVDAAALETGGLQEIADHLETNGTNAHGTGAWDAVGGGLTQQQARDAMKLAPTVGAPAAGSVDEHLDDILADTAAVEPLVSANLDATVTSRESEVSAAARAVTNQAEHDATQAALVALNDLDQADIQAALTAQGYTVARAAELSEILDHVKNRLFIDFGPTPAELVLRNRADSGDLFRWQLETEGGEKVSTQFGVQTKRGVPV